MFSFTARKKTVEIYPYIRRLCDLTTPNRATSFSGRSEFRYNRAIPTLLSPWEDDRPVVDECLIGLTGDLADRGVGLILNQPFHADSVVLGYWLDQDDMREPWYFLGKTSRHISIGGGYWMVGVELAEFANPNYVDSLELLKPWSAKLIPEESMVQV